jgi:hypothetical protein
MFGCKTKLYLFLVKETRHEDGEPKMNRKLRWGQHFCSWGNTTTNDISQKL